MTSIQPYSSGVYSDFLKVVYCTEARRQEWGMGNFMRRDVKRISSRESRDSIPFKFKRSRKAKCSGSDGFLHNRSREMGR
jgi:hypothetical protein